MTNQLEGHVLHHKVSNQFRSHSSYQLIVNRNSCCSELSQDNLKDGTSDFACCMCIKVM